MKTYIIQGVNQSNQTSYLWSTSNGYRFVPNGYTDAMRFNSLVDAKRTKSYLEAVGDWKGLKFKIMKYENIL